MWASSGLKATVLLGVAGTVVQGTKFLRCHGSFTVGADIQPLGAQRLPLPVGQTHLGAQQTGIALRLRRPAINGVGIARVFLHVWQGRQSGVTVV
jgi:hypothetical protein